MGLLSRRLIYHRRFEAEPVSPADPVPRSRRPRLQPSSCLLGCTDRFLAGLVLGGSAHRAPTFAAERRRLLINHTLDFAGAELRSIRALSPMCPKRTARKWRAMLNE